MLDIRSARDRAVRLAVLSGHMPDFDLIHSRQRTEGFDVCFGRCTTICPQTHCRWHRECSMLVASDEIGQNGRPAQTQGVLSYRP